MLDNIFCDVQYVYAIYDNLLNFKTSDPCGIGLLIYASVLTTWIQWLNPTLMILNVKVVFQICEIFSKWLSQKICGWCFGHMFLDVIGTMEKSWERTCCCSYWPCVSSCTSCSWWTIPQGQKFKINISNHFFRTHFLQVFLLDNFAGWR